MRRCTRCGRFVGDSAQVIPIRDSVHPYTADYDYLCTRCADHQSTDRITTEHTNGSDK